MQVLFAFMNTETRRVRFCNRRRNGARSLSVCRCVRVWSQLRKRLDRSRYEFASRLIAYLSDGTSEASSPSLSSRVAVGPTTTRPQVLARHLCPAPTPTVQPCRVLSAADVLDVVGARSPSSGVACSGR